MREVLRADKGYIYTNGEIYGTVIYLAETVSKDGFYQITKEGFDKVSYKETEHYMLTKSFLNNPERMLKYLFDDEDD